MKVAESIDLEKYAEGRKKKEIAQHADDVFMNVADEVDRSENNGDNIVSNYGNSSTGQEVDLLVVWRKVEAMSEDIVEDREEDEVNEETQNQDYDAEEADCLVNWLGQGSEHRHYQNEEENVGEYLSE